VTNAVFRVGASTKLVEVNCFCYQSRKVGGVVAERLKNFARDIQKASELQTFLKMQLDEDFASMMYVANLLQKIMLHNLKKFLAYCDYVPK
jgi:hypothetical protein